MTNRYRRYYIYFSNDFKNKTGLVDCDCIESSPNRALKYVLKSFKLIKLEKISMRGSADAKVIFIGDGGKFNYYKIVVANKRNHIIV